MGNTEKLNADHSPILVGWREWVSLPGICLPAVKAKIDTGAKTSALHTYSLETFRQDGVDMIRFQLHPLQRRNDLYITCHAVLKDERVVSDSGGHRELRPVIETEIHLAGKQWPIEVTLSNRENMLFRMLLGRTAMSGRIVVDPEASYLTGKKLVGYYRRHPELLTKGETL
ncbi:MAG: ATP-dependent zinc protease [Candidatus Marinimicrobia bacterium]|nr:ATP-dependent zinc protease [Candidatus Neomarinimicrobiota bacterium]